MDSELASLFVEHSATTFRRMNGYIEKCLERVTDDQIWSRGATHENSIGNLILHLCGNVRQRIISGVGGAKDIRDRDAEFATQGGVSKAELIRMLHETVEEASAVIEKASPERLAEQIVTQGESLAVLKAIYQAVGHFQQHTGQIIFATKILGGEDLGLQRPPKS